MGKPLPEPTPETLPYWEGAREGELRLQRCDACGRHVFYPRPDHCPHCGSGPLRWVRASGRARLASYVISHLPAPGWEDEAPYAIALVELEEGPRLMTSLVGVEPDPRALALDMALEVDFEPRGAWALPVFRPAGAR